VSQEKYHYDRDFQAAVLAIMVREPKALPNYRDVLDPRYFGDPDHRTIARQIVDHYDEFNTAPTWPEVRAKISDHCYKLEVDPDELLEMVNQLVDYDQLDTDFVLARILRFGRRQEMRFSLGKIIDLLDEDEDFDEARPLLERALSVGASRESGIELFKSVDNLEELADDSAFGGDRIPTGIPALDEALHGGVAGPQFGILQAAPKTGKSTTLVSFGTAGMLDLARRYDGNGMKTGVLHISHELYEDDLLYMYLARLTGLARNECAENPELVRECWSEVKKYVLEDQLRIKYFAPWTLTSGGLRDYLGRLRAQGWTPRTVILDYMDRMKINRENSYQAYGQLIDELIGIANDFEFNIWTGTQSNRSGYQADKANASQAADSWLKVANADIYIPISQTYQERLAHEVRLNVEFLRRGEDGFEIPCRIDYARATVKQSGSPVRA